MADLTGYEAALGTSGTAAMGNLSGYWSTSNATAPTVYYTMTGVDAVLTTEGSWTVSSAPDFTGAQYTGGLATPLRNIRSSPPFTK